MSGIVPDTLKHYVWHPQTHCLTISNMLFDNFNTCISSAKSLYLRLTNWQPVDYVCMRILGIFCPFDFWNDFRGHSRDSKRLIIDYIFSAARQAFVSPCPVARIRIRHYTYYILIDIALSGTFAQVPVMRHANRRRSKKVEKYLVGREKMLTFAPAKVRIALARMLTIHWQRVT